MIPKYLYLKMRGDGCTHAEVLQFAEAVERHEMVITESDWSQLKTIYFGGGSDHLKEVLKEMKELYI